MRILFLADAVSEDLAGGSRVVARELALGLARRGHDITFLVARQPTPALAADRPSNEVRDGIRIVRYGGAGKFIDFVRAGKKAAANLQREKPFDIVHSHFAYAALGPLRAISKQTPHIRTFHGPWDEEGWIEDASAANGLRDQVKARLKQYFRYQIERINLKQSAAVIVLSEYFRAKIIDRFRVDTKVTHKIVGGVDLNRFTPAKDHKEVRIGLSLPTDRTIILTIRRLAARMGIDNLIEAMPAVLAADPTALLLIGGTGPERARIEDRIESLRLQSCIRLLGFIPEDQLASYYQSADLFALPTLALEGFGLVTVEALSSGVPVVATPVGATPEILNSVPGCVVCSGTAPAELAAGISACLQQSVSPEGLHDYVKRTYSWEAHTAEVEQLYKFVVAQQVSRKTALSGPADQPFQLQP